MSTEANTSVAAPKVVTLAFRKVVRAGGFCASYKKVGNPVLEIEVLGDTHTFQHVGEALFQHYLGEILQEELYEHVWRFSPCDDDIRDAVALLSDIPILSKGMKFGSPFQSFVDCDDEPQTPYRRTAGSELIFSYDEGSPTRLAVTVEAIHAMPENKNIEDFPLVKSNVDEVAVGEKRKRIAEARVLTITMDEAYPYLSARMKDHRTLWEIGRGSEQIPGTKIDEGYWARIWGGGGKNPAYDRSVECPFPFTDIDEALLCLEKGIERQISADGPVLTRTIERKRPTGEVYREEEERSDDDEWDNFSVVLQAYPSSVLPSQCKPEMERDMPSFDPEYTRPGKEPKDPKVRSWSRYAFNFSLPAAWRQDPHNTVFSFAAQFPKCALWLTYPAKSCYWMSLERGVLCAIKGKNHCQGANNVVHKTLKHDTLHAMFADMEEQIVLPVSWKYKHRK